VHAQSDASGKPLLEWLKCTLKRHKATSKGDIADGKFVDVRWEAGPLFWQPPSGCRFASRPSCVHLDCPTCRAERRLLPEGYPHLPCRRRLTRKHLVSIPKQLHGSIIARLRLCPLKPSHVCVYDRDDGFDAMNKLAGIEEVEHHEEADAAAQTGDAGTPQQTGEAGRDGEGTGEEDEEDEDDELESGRPPAQQEAQHETVTPTGV
jgi:hypothetical protein